MICHVSMFVFKPEYGHQKKFLRAFQFQLNQLETGALRSKVAVETEVPAAGIPVVPEGSAHPIFCNAIQVLTFDTPESAASYLQSDAHQMLMVKFGIAIETVASIDFQL